MAYSTMYLVPKNLYGKLITRANHLEKNELEKHNTPCSLQTNYFEVKDNGKVYANNIVPSKVSYKKVGFKDLMDKELEISKNNEINDRMDATSSTTNEMGSAMDMPNDGMDMSVQAAPQNVDQGIQAIPTFSNQSAQAVTPKLTVPTQTEHTDTRTSSTQIYKPTVGVPTQTDPVISRPMSTQIHGESKSMSTQIYPGPSQSKPTQMFAQPSPMALDLSSPQARRQVNAPAQVSRDVSHEALQPSHRSRELVRDHSNGVLHTPHQSRDQTNNALQSSLRGRELVRDLSNDVLQPSHQSREFVDVSARSLNEESFSSHHPSQANMEDSVVLPPGSTLDRAFYPSLQDGAQSLPDFSVRDQGRQPKFTSTPRRSPHITLEEIMDTSTPQQQHQSRDMDLEFTNQLRERSLNRLMDMVVEEAKKRDVSLSSNERSRSFIAPQPARRSKRIAKNQEIGRIMDEIIDQVFKDKSRSDSSSSDARMSSFSSSSSSSSKASEARSKSLVSNPTKQKKGEESSNSSKLSQARSKISWLSGTSTGARRKTLNLSKRKKGEGSSSQSSPTQGRKKANLSRLNVSNSSRLSGEKILPPKPTRGKIKRKISSTEDKVTVKLSKRLTEPPIKLAKEHTEKEESEEGDDSGRHWMS